MTLSSAKYLLNFSWQNIKILFNPNDLTSIWKMRLHPSWSIARQYLDFYHSQPDLVQNLKKRPNHSKFYSSIVLSRKFPKGSLGDSFQQFLYDFKVGTDFYPDLIDVQDELDFLNSHIIAVHDLWHIALGFESNLLGEIKLSAFTMAQIRSPMHTGFVLVALMAGFFKKGEYLSQIMDSITEGWRLGNQCQSLMVLEWENWLDKPVEALREHIGYSKLHH